MLRANHESPVLRQRWIELFNAGIDGSGGAGEKIPAFGVVEVIDSERPDSAGTATPDGGRTVLHVRRATTDMPKITVVNGPCEIAGWEVRQSRDDGLAHAGSGRA